MNFKVITSLKRRGAASVGEVLNIFMIVPIAFFVGALLFELGMNVIVTASTTAWNPLVTLTYSLLFPVLILIVLVIGAIGAIRYLIEHGGD